MIAPEPAEGGARFHFDEGKYCFDHTRPDTIPEAYLLTQAMWLRPGYYWCDAGHYRHVTAARVAWIRRLAEAAVRKFDTLPINALLPFATVAAALGFAVMHHHWQGHVEVWTHFGCWVATHTTHCATPPQF